MALYVKRENEYMLPCIMLTKCCGVRGLGPDRIRFKGWLRRTPTVWPRASHLATLSFRVLSRADDVRLCEE